MVERILFLIDFKNVFISIPLNILDIESKEDSDTNESEEFNAGIQTYLTFEREYEEFIVISVNLNTTKNDNEEYPYDKDDLYLEFNNVRHYSIVWISCIYDYCIFYLGSKATNNFFFKAIFKLIKKVYIEKEIRHQILTIRITMYRTFIPSFEHPPIYIKEEAILEGCQELFYLKYYLEKTKKQYKNRNKNDDITPIQNWVKKIKLYKKIKKIQKKNNNNLKKVRVKIFIENLQL